MAKIFITINSNSENGYFKTTITTETGFSVSLYAHSHSQLTQHINAEEDELIIQFDTKILDIPENIKKNLLDYLSKSNLAYFLKNFTCHQFAYLIKGIGYKSSKVDNTRFVETKSSFVTSRCLSSGDLITMHAPKGDDTSKSESLHSAIYLGEELFLSTFGLDNFCITTLDAMVKKYSRTTFITVTPEFEQTSSEEHFVNNQFMHRHFITRLPSGTGLLYAFLGIKITKEMLDQNMYPVIREAYKKLCLKFHPDKKQVESDEEFKLLKSVHDVLCDPITRSQYHTRLREGEDWTLAGLLRLSLADKQLSKIIEQYNVAFELLSGSEFSEHRLMLQEERIYQRACKNSSTLIMNDKSEVRLSISPKIEASEVGNNPLLFYASDITFDEQQHPLSERILFRQSENTRVGNLNIHRAVDPVQLSFTANELERNQLTEEIQAFLNNNAICTQALKKSLDHLTTLSRLMFPKNNQNKIKVTSQFCKDVKLLPYTLALVSGSLNIPAVYLGGNNLLIKSKTSNAFFICNLRYLTDKWNAHTLYQVYCPNDLNTENTVILENAKKLGRLFITHIQGLHQPVDMKEYLKLMLRTYPKMDKPRINLLANVTDKQNTSLPTINIKVKKSVVLNQVISSGSRIAFSNMHRESIVTAGIFLGEHLVLISLNGSLYVTDMLSVVETFPYVTHIYQLEQKNSHVNNVFNYDAFLFKNVRNLHVNEGLEIPLLYALLDIPCNPARLSTITTEQVQRAYKKRIESINRDPDPFASEKIKILQHACQLLTNPTFRIGYGLNYRAGTTPDFSELMRLEKKSRSDYLYAYYSALALLEKHPNLVSKLEAGYYYSSILHSIKKIFLNIESSHDKKRKGIFNYYCPIVKASSLQDIDVNVPSLNLDVCNEGFFRFKMALMKKNRDENRTDTQYSDLSCAYHDCLEQFPWFKKKIGQINQLCGTSFFTKPLSDHRYKQLFKNIWRIASDEERQGINELAIQEILLHMQELFVRTFPDVNLKIKDNESVILSSSSSDGQRSIDHGLAPFEKERDTSGKTTIEINFFIFYRYLHYLYIKQLLEKELHDETNSFSHLTIEYNGYGGFNSKHNKTFDLNCSFQDFSIANLIFGHLNINDLNIKMKRRFGSNFPFIIIINKITSLGELINVLLKQELRTILKTGKTKNATVKTSSRLFKQTSLPMNNQVNANTDILEKEYCFI